MGPTYHYQMQKRNMEKNLVHSLYHSHFSLFFLLHASEENLRLQQWCHWWRKCSVYYGEHPVVLLKTRRKPNKKRSYKQNNKPHLKLRRAPLGRLFYTLFTLLSTYISLSLSRITCGRWFNFIQILYTIRFETSTAFILKFILFPNITRISGGKRAWRFTRLCIYYVIICI